MIAAFTTLALFMLWAADVSLSVLITQWPQYISSLPNGSAEMHCYQNNTDYQYVYWYRQLRGRGFQLIVSAIASTANFEEGFKSGFQAVTSKEKQSSLTITSVQTKDEAVYLCAASLHKSPCSYTEAYFGAGTKLTVLEKDPKPPKVEVLRPSPKECKNGQRNKTLVCVATGFYPDHVSLSWQINGVGVTKGVATDEAAQWMPGERFYQITSRLRVSEEDWYNPKKQFNCTVNFYNGSDTVPYIGSISGKANTITRGEYLKITQSAKLTYGVFIAKSCIYGAFVAFLVWKLQGSNGKQNY
ncbi:M1-specific T cell receptor beta chain-like [Morone saxatilis]|uniref:M1-specific T cell receptor beta chain-like n=1 Tax=Morone saxatilis TaxID=34816 RepID=UPI0015E21A84|nr:M1-specific T cell receptor beta chain-like [Morone saxatilis]